MKTTLSSALLLVAIAVASSFSSCNLGCKKGSGRMVTETRDAGTFSKIAISGSFNVTIKQDSASSIKITGDDNLMKQITTEITGDKLEMKTEDGICPSGKITVSISTKTLSLIKAAGEVKVTSDGKITAKDFDFDLSGASKIDMDLNADNVTTTGSGITDMTLTGQAVSHKIELSGSGQVNALNFVVGKCRIESSGATDFKINVLNDLELNTSGASNIEYRGNPKNISNSKSGIGTLKKVD